MSQKPQPQQPSSAALNDDYKLLAYREKRIKLLRQQTLRHNSRMLKLKRSNLLYFFNLIALFVLQVIAIYFFELGFLLSRLVLPNVSLATDLRLLLEGVPHQSVQFYQKTFDKSKAFSLHSSNQLFKEELIASLSGQGWVQPKFKKSILIVIDALRFDFVVPIDETDPGFNPNYHNNFPLLYQMYSQNPQNAALYKFMADPPTTTLQRLKGLTTGSLPTFIDAGSNFDGDEIDEDNIILQLARHNKNITLIGDDTWDNLFHPYLNNNLSWPYESLNVWDIHTVDDGVLEHIFPLLDTQNPDSESWQLIVGHFLGLDHVGHRYGPNNFEMINKQKQMDIEMRRLMNSIDDDTLLIIMGDHGMDPTGNHGGDSKQELESTLFLYSKNSAFTNDFVPATNYTVDEYGFLTFSNVSSSHKYTLDDLDSQFHTVHQIDFVSSFSLLTGIPIPYNNLGKPINNLHTDESSYPDQLSKLLQLVKMNYVNILNLQRYKLTLIEKTNERALQQQETFDVFLRIVQKVNEINVVLNGKTKIPMRVAELETLLSEMIQYQDGLLRTFQEIWATFNNLFIYIGIILMAFSLVILILLAKIIPSIVFNQLITEFLTIIILMIFFWSIIINAIYFVLRPSMFNLTTTNLLGVAIGIIFGFLIIIFDRYNINWLFKQFKFFVNDIDSTWSFISITFMIIMFISYSSNSFIIFQDSIINFLLINYGLYNLWIFVRKYIIIHFSNVKISSNKNFQDKKIKLIYGIIHSILFIVVQKLNSLIRTCREEQSNHCPKMITNTKGQSSCETTNNFTLISLALLVLASSMLPNILQHFLNLGNANSYQNSAKLWIGNFLRIVLYANCLYWFLDYLEFHPDFNTKFFNLSFSFLKNSKVIIARLVVGLCLVLGNFAWSKGPLCIKLVFPDRNYAQRNNNTIEEPHEGDVLNHVGISENELTDNKGEAVNKNNNKLSTVYKDSQDEANQTGKTKIVGYENIYGLSYLLLILNFFGAILITSKPFSSISLILLMYQMLTTIELLNLLDLRNNMIGPIIFNLLGYSFFYSTDHQVTINSIKWELAFQLMDSIMFPFSHIPIVLNSFGSFILVSLSVNLLVIWKIPPNTKPISLISKIIVTCLTLLMSQTAITLSSLIFTNFFKRHLMVWKIFVPSFLFNSLVLVVLNVVIIFVGFFFGVTKLVHQINRIFGKQ